MAELSATAGKRKCSQDMQVDEKLVPKKGKLNHDYFVLGFYGGFFMYSVIIQRNEFIPCKSFDSFLKSGNISGHFSNI